MLTMMFYSLLVLGLLFVEVSVSQGSEEPELRLVDRRFSGLNFGPTRKDYILFKPRMEAVQEAFSVCAWVKKMRTGNGIYPYWFSYGTPDGVQEITVSDYGFFHTLSTGVHLGSKMTDQIGTWKHMCNTWSLTSRTTRLYYDGVDIGSGTTSALLKKLGPNWYVALGNVFHSHGGGYRDFKDYNAFGGELYKVNVFDKELNSSEVLEMKEGGMCSEVEEKYGRRRYLKWEDLLLEEKSGNVSEIDVGCHPGIEDEDQAEERKSTEECDCNQESQTTSSRWDLLRGQKFLNKTVSMEMVEELKRSWDILGKTEDYLLLNTVDLLLLFKMHGKQ